MAVLSGMDSIVSRMLSAKDVCSGLVCSSVWHVLAASLRASSEWCSRQAS